MPKTNINKKNSKNKKNNNNKYNADNEIIIGVTTKPKERVRVENKKTTRPTKKTTQKKIGNINSKSTKNISDNKKSAPIKKKVQGKNIKIINDDIIKEKEITKINRKKVIISIIIILFIALGGTIYYLTTPVFNIANIEVYGNEKNTVETYISLSRIDIGTTNIFAITNKGIKKNIKENPYVEDVTIERKLPNTLQIYITERKVSYQIEYSGNYIYLDNQGYILEVAEDKKDVVFIKGFSTVKEVIQEGQRLNEEDLVKLNTVVKIINYCNYNTIENKITNIDITNDTNYIVEFKKDKKTVYLGDASNLSERLSLLKTILKNEEDKEIEIFMNGDLNEDDVYIRYVED